METYIYMGHDGKYWSELQKHVELMGGIKVEKLINDNAKLRAKVSFYESRIEDMVSFGQLKIVDLNQP